MITKRKAIIKRKTTETDVTLTINLDGKGKAEIKSPIGFLNHMLTLFAKHGNFDLKLEARGDVKVDIHHTNEDIGICLGLAIKEALKNKEGIGRFGFCSVVMDEALTEVVLDLSGRPYFKLTADNKHLGLGHKEYSLNYLKQFLQTFAVNSGITLHTEVIYGEDPHHIMEAIFKALGRALKAAVSIDSGIKGIPSTKGRL